MASKYAQEFTLAKTSHVIKHRRMKYLIFLFIISCSTLVENNKKNHIRIAVSAAEITGGNNYKDFIKKIENEIIIAKKHSSQYIVFPELYTFDLFSKEPKDIKHEINEISKINQTLIKDLKDFSKKYQIYIIGPSNYYQENINTILNRAYLFSPLENEIGFQDKIYPTPWEKTHRVSQGKSIKSFKTNDFTFSLLICHDVEFPNISQNLLSDKPEIIFVISMTDDNWGQNRVIRTAQARAIEHMSYVFLTGNTSLPKQKWHNYQGGSYLFTPQNKYFSEENNPIIKNKKLSIYELSLDSLRKSRSDNKQIYPARDLEFK